MIQTAERIVDILLEGDEPSPEDTEFFNRLTQGALDSDLWVKAQQAWDTAVRCGFGGNPWIPVFRTLGYDETRANVLADQVTDMMADVDDPEGNPGAITADEVWRSASPYLKLVLDRPEHLDAIKRLWYRQLG